MPRKSKVYSVAIGAMLVGGLVASQSAVSEPDVLVTYQIVDEITIPKALTDTPGDAANGRKVAINRKLGNCLACHAISAIPEQPYHGEVGPTLDGVADRFDASELRLRLVDANQVIPGTMMPSFYVNEGYTRLLKGFEGKSILTAQQVEDLVAFLGTLKEEN